MARFLAPVLGVIAALFLLPGCGGGVPLLHGAHALSPGKTTTSVGFSGVFTTGSLRDAVEAARRGESSNDAAKEGTVVTAVGPGVAPLVGMRIGVGADNEVGLSYTGRAMRLDARHAFESGPWALSVGAGVASTLGSIERHDPSVPDRVAGRAGSYGADVPVLFGWQSDAGVVSLWGGARGGLERIGYASSPDADLLHWSAGGIVGLIMGFRHVHVALALETTYHAVKGKFGQADAEVHGLTLTPAGGLLFTF